MVKNSIVSNKLENIIFYKYKTQVFHAITWIPFKFKVTLQSAL